MSTSTKDTGATKARPKRRSRASRGQVDAIASAPRRRKRRIIIVAVLVVLLGGAAAWAVWFSSWLTVSSVRVLGVEGPSAAEALQAAAIPMGVQLARVDTDSATVRVAALDWVASAEVRRGWPQEVVVAVVPRVPVAALATSPTSGVDAEGMAFDVGDTAELKELPKVDAAGEALVEAMTVVTALPPDLAKKVTKVSAGTKDSVELTLKSGDLVRWGSADKHDEKVAVLRVLLERKASVYDVSAPSSPTVYRG